jgi:N-acetyl-alpha-D-glucosaminyl L-malate synthase BshA
MVCYPTFGGSGVVATELGKALASQGHEVHFITYEQPVRLGSFHENVYYHEVHVAHNPLYDFPPYALILASKLVDVTRHVKLDLIHVHYAIPHASSAYLAQNILRDQGIDIPIVTTLHGTDITLLGKDPSFEPVIAFAINKSNAVTAVSESLRSDTLATFDVQRPIDVIPNFFCPSHFASGRNDAMRRVHAPEGEKLLIHVSNFRPVKRVLDVVRVFAIVRKTMRVRLLMVGDGPDRLAVEALCRELGLCEDVVMLGKLKNPIEAISTADLFVLPSESESFGLAALEAMAAGVPVLASRAGGLPEVVEHGVSGLLCKVGDIDAMAAGALEILGPGHAQFVAGALASADKFRVDRVVPAYEAVYERVLDRSQTT